MIDLWPDFTDNVPESCNAVNILREQARLLEKKTERKVRATFSQIQFSSEQSLEDEYFNSIELQNEVLEHPLHGKHDANMLYQFTKYKFEIYNNVYRFRVFTVDNRDFFPVYLNLDEGIAREIGTSTFNTIQSNEQLTHMLAKIFASSKLRNIIGKMLRDFCPKKHKIDIITEV